MKYFLGLFSLGPFLLAPILSAQPLMPDDCTFFEVGERPESVTRGFDGDLFVTVMGGKESGDAMIVRIKGGEMTEFATGLNEPKGIAMVRKQLVFTDLDRVMTVDGKGRVKELAGPSDFPHPVSYLNDVCSDAKQKGVYVVEMGDRGNLWESTNPHVFWNAHSEEARTFKRIGRVYHVDLKGRVETIVEPSEIMLTPNGVGLDNDNNLLIGAFFNGYLLRYEDDELQIVRGNMRGADAVEQDSEGNYYVSSWNQGTVWKIFPSGLVTVLGEGFDRAADFYLDDENDVIYLPDMGAGRVYVLPL